MCREKFYMFRRDVTIKFVYARAFQMETAISYRVYDIYELCFGF